MYLAWRYGGGMNPFQLYHELDADYVPWEGGEPVRPLHPERVKSLIYGFAMQANDEAAAMAGGGV